MTLTAEISNSSIHDSFGTFNRNLRKLRLLVHRHKDRARGKWFKPRRRDRDQQLYLEGEVESLKKELSTLETNSPTYWGVFRIVQRMRKHLKFTGDILRVRFELDESAVLERRASFVEVD